MATVGPSDWLWKQETGFYTGSAAQLVRNPLLPNERFVQDRRMMELFHRHGGLAETTAALEIGCGQSPWLPYLARTYGCAVTGLDIEQHAADLAQANLIGAGVTGEIFCRDAFDPALNEDLAGRFDLVFSLGVVEHLPNVSDHLAVLAGYLRSGGRLLTIVPNLQGLNWALQRFASRRVLDAHVVYTPETLRQAHERAGIPVAETGYLGFLNGFLSSSLGARGARQRLHTLCCRSLAIASAAWSRTGLATPEWRWMAPLVYVVGHKAPPPNAKDMVTAAAGHRQG